MQYSLGRKEFYFIRFSHQLSIDKNGMSNKLFFLPFPILVLYNHSNPASSVKKQLCS